MTHDIQAQLVEEADWLRANPDGLSVFAVTDDEALARRAAPLIAAELHPDRVAGPILHVERTGIGYEVVLRDLGAARWKGPTR